jgi:hypothetical protein
MHQIAYSLKQNFQGRYPKTLLGRQFCPRLTGEEGMGQWSNGREGRRGGVRKLDRHHLTTLFINGRQECGKLNGSG